MGTYCVKNWLKHASKQCIIDLLQVFLQYTRYVAVLKWLAMTLLAYVAALVMVEVNWREALVRLFVPSVAWEREYLQTVVAVLGTTISPYLFFWQASQEAEDVRAIPHRQILRRAPRQGEVALDHIGLDTLVGMGFSNLVALAIMLTTAATLNVSGVTNIETSAQAAEALRPIAGAYASIIFAFGVTGTSLLATPSLLDRPLTPLARLGNSPWGLGASRWRQRPSMPQSRSRRSLA